jgi:hypothetical protein
MPKYAVTLRLTADDHDALLARIAAWEDMAEEEGVLSVATEPEFVVVPHELRVTPTTPLAPSEPPPPPPES